jgi:hypothetical protein
MFGYQPNKAFQYNPNPQPVPFRPPTSGAQREVFDSENRLIGFEGEQGSNNLLGAGLAAANQQLGDPNYLAKKLNIGDQAKALGNWNGR